VLEVKTFFDRTTLATSSSMESTFQSLDFPLMAINGIAGKEGRRNLHTRGYKVELERLGSARQASHDQDIKLLDMPRLQVINDS
jgi:hypothetical protein